MLILRLDFQNGLHIEFNFPSEAIAHAQTTSERIAAAALNGERVLIEDYAGRSAHVDASKIQAIVLAEVTRETASVCDLNLTIKLAEMKWQERNGLGAPRTAVSGAPVRADA